MCNIHIAAYVDLDVQANRYLWAVSVYDWEGKHTFFKGGYASALKACLKAEEICERERVKLMPPWVEEALAHNWFPSLASIAP